MARDVYFRIEDRGKCNVVENSTLPSVLYKAYAKKQLLKTGEYTSEDITNEIVKKYISDLSNDPISDLRKEYKTIMSNLYRCVNNASSEEDVDLSNIPIDNEYVRAYIIAVLSQNRSKSSTILYKINNNKSNEITFQNKVDFLQSIVDEMVLIDNDEIKELCLDDLKYRVFEDITKFVDNVELTDYLCAINDEVKFQDYIDSEYENKLNELIDSFKIKGAIEQVTAKRLKEKIHSYNYNDFYKNLKKKVIGAKFYKFFSDFYSENEELNNLYDYIRVQVENTLNDLYDFKIGNNIPVPSCFIKKEFIDDEIFNLSVNNGSVFELNNLKRTFLLQELKKGIGETLNAWKEYVKKNWK